MQLDEVGGFSSNWGSVDLHSVALRKRSEDAEGVVSSNPRRSGERFP